MEEKINVMEHERIQATNQYQQKMLVLEQSVEKNGSVVASHLAKIHELT